VDRQLIVRAKEGDERAFADLTSEIGARLDRAAYGILRDRDLAEDAMQAALVQIWRKLPTLRDPDRFDAWSYKLLVHACYAEAKRNPQWLPDSEVPTVHEPKAADDLAAVLDRDELERVFARLSIDQRVVIVLHFHLDMTFEQIAKTLSIPKGTVASRLRRAMRVMRTALRADDHAVASPVRQEALR
jgi:RNA polymerase sigma-70 factor (ECF subfamily)